MISRRQRFATLFARLVQKPALATPWPQPVARRIFDLNALLVFSRPLDMQVTPERLGGVPGAWVTRAGQAEHGVLLYLHGGGFVIGSLSGYRHLVARLGAAAGLRAYFVDYRLAPEHPCPAAPDDALAAYRALLEAGHDPARIALAGDSAGGWLVARLLRDIARLELPMPGRAAFLSPITDLTFSNPSMTENRSRDPLLPVSWAKRSVAAFLAGQDASAVGLSPLSGAVAGWPPCMIQVSDIEILRDDSLQLADAIGQAGGSVDLRLWRDVPHVWQLMAGRTPEADAAIEELALFLQKIWSAPITDPA